MSVEAMETGRERRRLRLPALTREDRDFDLRNTWQIAVGAILLPLGIVVILLAWEGAANARVDQQQIPYMVSGGFIGLGLMIVGGLMFWAHWLYRIYDQANLQHRELLEAINRLSGVQQPSPATATASTSGERFVVTGTGTTFHRPGCSVVKGRRGTRAISAADAESMSPCRICEPLG
jgi:hypothetical protein